MRSDAQADAAQSPASIDEPSTAALMPVAPDWPAPTRPQAFTAMLLRNVRILGLILLPALVISCLATWRADDWQGFGRNGLPEPFPAPLIRWDDHVAALDQAIATHRERAAREPTDWLSPSAEAASWLDRATMTGRWQDYAEAEQALAQAMARAPDSNKPYTLAARLALALHRNDAVEPALRAAVADRTFNEAAAQADAAAMRGDVALYQGDWRAADRLYLAAMTRLPDAAFAFRRALIIERTTPPGTARQAWIHAAWINPRPSRRMLSATAMRLGNAALGCGDWDEAARWYDEAERLLPGDWHIAALRLQMQALRGDVAGAVAGMARLAEAHDAPELWDALASWRQSLGDAAGARTALTRAGEGWAPWLVRYPAAASAHAAEHALIAHDTASAVQWAESNYRRRPYGDAGILLASALAAHGQIERARAVLTQATRSGWRTAESDRLGFELAALAGDSRGAEQARDAAVRRNPRAFDPAARLILFGLH